MIDPQNQWCIQIDVTNHCSRQCSNCTHLVGHAPIWYMNPDQFYAALTALSSFPPESPPAHHTSRKLVGIIGGEPLLNPYFNEFASMTAELIPHEYRGLWTGLLWKKTAHAALIEQTFPEHGIHCNQHDRVCYHTPVLVASADLITDPAERARLIDNCWLQRMWSSSITPKGFFFCEVAASMDATFDGPGGLPVEPDCWKRPITDFQSQIDRWCHRCGVPLNLKGRPATDTIDDITPTNLSCLPNSPKCQKGLFEIFDESDPQTSCQPWIYKL